MLIGIIISLVIFVLFLFYKLSDVNWYHQFFTQNFKDSDIFTRFIKFVMS